MFKLVKLIGLFAATVSMFLLISLVAFAEGDGIHGCSGMIVGEGESPNVNAGVGNFDSHPQVDIDTDGKVSSKGVSPAVGKIIGYANVIAPGLRELAACVELDGDEYSKDDHGVPTPDQDEFLVKGYVWNENLGFINFYCGEDGKDIAGEDCGGHDYGVTVGPADEQGFRILSGHAWNPVFGYIDFNVLGDETVHAVGGEDAADQLKKVYIDSDGNFRGYAWTEAGVWMGFAGARMYLPGDGPEDEIKDDCDIVPPPPVCSTIEPVPGFTIDGKVTEENVVADGKDFYNIRMYLTNSNGSPAEDLTDFKALSLTFHWKDTVRKDQRVGADDENSNFDEDEYPWDDEGDSDGGAILYKPVEIDDKADFDKVFVAVDGEPGVYELKPDLTIRSYAPTSNANLSDTTSTSPIYSVRNDVFLTDALDIGGEQPIPNELILYGIEYDVTYEDDTSYADTIHPNDLASLPLKFEPAVNVDTLYANGLQDMIEVARAIPINFTLAVKKAATMNSITPDFKFFLTLDEPEDNACTTGFDFEYHNPDPNNIVATGDEASFAFSAVPDNLYAVASLAGVDCEESCVEGEGYEACAAEKQLCEEAACSFAGGAGIHSEIHYKKDNRDVYYYGNKLPRSATTLVNPVAVIHGSIRAPKAFSPSKSQITQATGDSAVDIDRDAVDEMVMRKIDVKSMIPDGGTCTISDLKLDGTSTIFSNDDCEDGIDYVLGSVVKGDKAYNYIYFNGIDKDLDVIVKLQTFAGNWTIITEGARVKIHDDIYDPSGEARFALIVMREEGGACSESNIYIDANVKDIQSNIVADCSFFSYDSSRDAPILAGSAGWSVGLPNGLSVGLPNWDGFEERTEVLSNQLFVNGSISSRNTYGGADLDADGLPYLLLGTGRTVGFSDAERLLAQLYDANYSRMFKLKLELSAAGLPVDQACGKGLTIEDMLLINEKKEQVATAVPSDGDVIGNKEIGVWYGGKQCDGINPFNKFDESEAALDCFSETSLSECQGDLKVLIEDEEKLSQGLGGAEKERYEPFYIFHKSPDSFALKVSTRTTTQ